MFSGIVEELGEVAAFDGERLDIKASDVLSDLGVSDSICVSGACLTVIETVEGGFIVEVVPETIERTNFGALKPGSPVNLERPLEYGGRVGGHFVQGHVDAGFFADLALGAPGRRLARSHVQLAPDRRAQHEVGALRTPDQQHPPTRIAQIAQARDSVRQISHTSG